MGRSNETTRSGGSDSSIDHAPSDPDNGSRRSAGSLSRLSDTSGRQKYLARQAQARDTMDRMSDLTLDNHHLLTDLPGAVPEQGQGSNSRGGPARADYHEDPGHEALRRVRKAERDARGQQPGEGGGCCGRRQPREPLPGNASLEATFLAGQVAERMMTRLTDMESRQRAFEQKQDQMSSQMSAVTSRLDRMIGGQVLTHSPCSNCGPSA